MEGTEFIVIDDVLRARLKTVGVSEYRCEMEAVAGRESGTEWRIIDVGGSRSQVRTLLFFHHMLFRRIFFREVGYLFVFSDKLT
jgi:hypothetical protein